MSHFFLELFHARMSTVKWLYVQIRIIRAAWIRVKQCDFVTMSSLSLAKGHVIRSVCVVTTGQKPQRNGWVIVFSRRAGDYGDGRNFYETNIWTRSKFSHYLLLCSLWLFYYFNYLWKGNLADIRPPRYPVVWPRQTNYISIRVVRHNGAHESYGKLFTCFNDS